MEQPPVTPPQANKPAKQQQPTLAAVAEMDEPELEVDISPAPQPSIQVKSEEPEPEPSKSEASSEPENQIECSSCYSMVPPAPRCPICEAPLEIN